MYVHMDANPRRGSVASGRILGMDPNAPWLFEMALLRAG